jgi:predicted HD superfamily hydrolase involved in NAD metabolism
MDYRITEDMIASLRIRVRKEVSYARYLHILGVERCAMRMAELMGDALERESLNTIRAAALLHDVTKDKGLTWFLDFIKKCSITVPEGESEQLYHTLTAPDYIASEYPEFASSEILSAVRKHTTGDAEMSVIDKIICLADYIEDGRKNFTCSQVRDYFYAYDFKNADADGRNNRLNNALLAAFRFTRDYVIKKNEKLSDRTNVAIMSLEKETEAYKNKSNLN